VQGSPGWKVGTYSPQLSGVGPGVGDEVGDGVGGAGVAGAGVGLSSMRADDCVIGAGAGVSTGAALLWRCIALALASMILRNTSELSPEKVSGPSLSPSSTILMAVAARSSTATNSARRSIIAVQK
jgi:hypothetical protein